PVSRWRVSDDNATGPAIMNSKRKALRRVFVALMLCAFAGAAHAQNWPARPITLVIPFGAGSSIDTLGRTFAEFASKELGQPVVVEDRPGGGGIVAAAGVSRAAPDGYTVILQAVAIILRPILDPSAGIDPAGDFSPVALLGETPNVVLGGANFP